MAAISSSATEYRKDDEIAEQVVADHHAVYAVMVPCRIVGFEMDVEAVRESHSPPIVTVIQSRGRLLISEVAGLRRRLNRSGSVPQPA
jgi:hypothetical protein